jgi:hypothetical protein
MTEPDEPVWFIREREAHAQGYRAGQAASAERIKALEEEVQNLRHEARIQAIRGINPLCMSRRLTSE